MKNTFGVFLFDKNNKLLVCHPTGFSTHGGFWSIPKGEPEENEKPEITAARELMEETGLEILPADLTFLGKATYKSGKKIVHGFIVKIKKDSNELEPKCHSYFTNSNNQSIPEVDKFQWVTIEIAELMLHEAQVILLNTYVKPIINKNS